MLFGLHISGSVLNGRWEMLFIEFFYVERDYYFFAVEFSASTPFNPSRMARWLSMI